MNNGREFYDVTANKFCIPQFFLPKFVLSNFSLRFYARNNTRNVCFDAKKPLDFNSIFFNRRRYRIRVHLPPDGEVVRGLRQEVKAGVLHLPCSSGTPNEKT